MLYLPQNICTNTNRNFIEIWVLSDLSCTQFHSISSLIFIVMFPIGRMPILPVQRCTILKLNKELGESLTKKITPFTYLWCGGFKIKQCIENTHGATLHKWEKLYYVWLLFCHHQNVSHVLYHVSVLWKPCLSLHFTWEQTKYSCWMTLDK